jgi:putative transposase
MPRIARLAPPKVIYHALTRGNNRQDIFKDREDFVKYMELLLTYKERYRFRLYHYVLMSNHVHLVLEPIDGGGSLSQIMKGLNLSYAQYYKKKYDYQGHFWQDRFKSIIISKDNYLLACGSYVELNPVRAGIVRNPGHYKWSSYRSYAYGDSNQLLDQNPIYLALSRYKKKRMAKYREFVRSMLKERTGQKGEMERRRIYGSPSFVSKVSKAYNIDEMIRKRGRPRTITGQE